MVQYQLRDSIETGDSLQEGGSIKMAKVIPAITIKSSEGAILPNEAIKMIELVPAETSQQKKDEIADPTLWIAGALLVILLVSLFLLRRLRIKNN